MTDTANNEGNEFLVGFNMLKDMSKDELIDEIISHQRDILNGMDDMDQLRINVIELRVVDYKKRLAAEAGLVPSIMGMYGKAEESDE